MEKILFQLRLKILKDEARRLSKHPNTKVSIFVEGYDRFFIYQSTVGWPFDVLAQRPEYARSKRRLSLSQRIQQILLGGGDAGDEEQGLLQGDSDGVECSGVSAK